MSVYYNELIGSRESKYDYLNTNDIDTTEWIELDVCKPYYFFVDKDMSAQDDYNKFVSISDVFKETSSGVKTSRDKLVIQKTQKDVWDVVNDFCNMDIETARKTYDLGEDGRDWKIHLAQNDIKQSDLNTDLIKQVLYRPFDTRYTYYTGNSKGVMANPCKKIMEPMIRGEIGVMFCRQHTKTGFYHIHVCNSISDIHTISDQTYLSPLYIYTNNTRTPNINQTIITTLTTTYNTTPSPEDIFYYIYGILHSNTYRQKYAELLKIDFPKIPFTPDHDMFMRIGAIGKQLADIHLMKPEVFNHSTISYHGSGENRIDKVSYDESTQRVYINKTQYFDMIPPEVWNYQIGGYRPSKKWLDDRRHDVLTPDDIDHYRYIGHALERTMELQIEIDMIYDDIDKDVII